MRSNLFAITFLIIMAIICGCAGGDSDPVGAAPGSKSPVQNALETESGRVLWGLWQCSMDPADSAMTITPLRTASFTANVNNLLEANPGNLIISDMDITDFLSEGRIDCTITLRHPLPGLDYYNGFDVWGVFMHNGSTPVGYDGLVYSDGSGDDEAMLLNPDGYTRWFNYEEFNGGSVPIFEYYPGKLSDLPDPSATLNPYRIFADGLNAEDDYYEWITTGGNADDRGMFSAGEVNSRRYELMFPMVGGDPVVSFQYAVIATWEPGDPELTGNPAIYDAFDFPSSANCEEAFLLNVSTLSSELYYVDSETYGGDFIADIEVFDWQGGSAGGTGVPNEIERMIFTGDFLPGGTYEFSQAELASVAYPATVNSSVFQVEIIDCTPLASGNSDFWVIVEAAGLNGGSYDQGFPTEYPDPACRAALMPSSVSVADESPAPPVVEYNFRISTNRTGTGLVEGIKLEWDEMPPEYSGVNIYKKSAYEPGSVWEMLPASPVGGTEYVDTDFLGYEGYMYYIVIWSGSVEGVPSQTGFILMENAEETVDTDSVWEDDWRDWGAPWILRWGPLGAGPHSPPPANGSCSWDESAITNMGTHPGDFWTGFWMLLCSPELPVEPDTSTAYVELMTRVQTYDWSPPESSGYPGGKMGVCESVDNDDFWPTDDHRSDFAYPVADVPGIYLWGAFPHCEAPEAGFAGSYSYWQLSSYNVGDVFTITSPRIGLPSVSVNNAGGYGWNVDDIAIIIY